MKKHLLSLIIMGLFCLGPVESIQALPSSSPNAISQSTQTPNKKEKSENPEQVSNSPSPLKALFQCVLDWLYAPEIPEAKPQPAKKKDCPDGQNCRE